MDHVALPHAEEASHALKIAQIRCQWSIHAKETTILGNIHAVFFGIFNDILARIKIHGSSNSQDQCAKVALTHLFRMRKIAKSGQLAGHMPACWQLKQPQNG